MSIFMIQMQSDADHFLSVLPVQLVHSKSVLGVKFTTHSFIHICAVEFFKLVQRSLKHVTMRYSCHVKMFHDTFELF